MGNMCPPDCICTDSDYTSSEEEEPQVVAIPETENLRRARAENALLRQEAAEVDMSLEEVQRLKMVWQEALARKEKKEMTGLL